MSRTPLEAFNRLLELAPDVITMYSHSPKEYLELLDAFLNNPGKHREHVELISQAAFAVQIGNQLPLINPAKSPLRFLPGFEFGFSEEHIHNLNRLKSDLLEDAQPGEFAFDLLPSRLMETPPEWASDLQIHLLEARVAVHPSHGLNPEKVSLSLTVDDETGVRFSDCFPATEFAEAGEYEVGLTREGRFVCSASAGGSIETGMKTLALGASARAEANIAGESSRTEKLSYRFKYPAKVVKVISSAVGKRARWETLRTQEQVPIGGMTFYSTVLAAKNVRQANIDVMLEVALEDWGSLQLPAKTVAIFSEAKLS